MPYAVLEKKISLLPPQFLRELSAFVDFLIYRQGEGKQQVEAIRPVRQIHPLPGYGSQISVKCDIFADDSSMWENA